MEHQANAFIKACFYQIRNIGRIQSLMSVDACSLISNLQNGKYNICSLVPSRLDYGNALLQGTCTNRSVINKLQRLKNSAARLITRKRKYDFITPVLVSLHWLPVQYCSQYKLLQERLTPQVSLYSLTRMAPRHNSSFKT